MPSSTLIISGLIPYEVASNLRHTRRGEPYRLVLNEGCGGGVRGVYPCLIDHAVWAGDAVLSPTDRGLCVTVELKPYQFDVFAIARRRQVRGFSFEFASASRPLAVRGETWRMVHSITRVTEVTICWQSEPAFRQSKPVIEEIVPHEDYYATRPFAR